MKKLGASLALAVITMAGAVMTATPAHAFPCPTGTPINTGPIGQPGVATVQLCTEGIRILPTGEITTVVQAGVTVLGQEECVVIGRVIIDTSPLSVDFDDRGLFGTPIFTTCPGT